MHTITIDEALDAMDTEIVLASSFDSRKKKAKDLKFMPAKQSYQVRYFDGKNEENETFTEINLAVDAYNEKAA